VVGGLWGRVCAEGACGTRGWEGTTRAGEGGLIRLAPNFMIKLHAVATFLPHFLGRIKKWAAGGITSKKRRITSLAASQMPAI